MILRALPATPARWSDLEALFGPRGACAGCWCMWPRLTARAYAAGQGAPNRRALRRRVAAGTPPGLIAYAGGEPVGWCAVAPRAEYARLATSRVMGPVDDTPVWSVPCFFVTRAWRGRGVTAFLLEAAKRFAARHGARVLEGYPIDARGGRLAPAFAWHGLAEAFAEAGFEEVARRSPTRPVMRVTLARARRAPGARPRAAAPRARRARG